MKISELLAALKSSVERDVKLDQSSTLAIYELLTKIMGHGDRSLEEVLTAMAFDTYAPVREPSTATEINRRLSVLTEYFEDDARFASVLSEFQADRSLTRDQLNQLFNRLFGKSRKLPAKASRAKLVQDIADLRLQRVRSKKESTIF